MELKSRIYCFHGMYIRFPFYVDTCAAFQKRPDIDVCYGEVEPHMQDAALALARLQIKPDNCVFRVDNIAKYAVHGGNQITLDL